MRQLCLLAILACSFWGALGADETTAIKQRTDAYLSAFKARDPKKMAELWAEDTKFTNPRTGKIVEGRQGLEEQFQEFFEDKPHFKLHIVPESIRFPKEDQAIEIGKAVISVPGQSPQETAFRVFFVKENGQWFISRINEVDWMEHKTHYDHLKGLEWLIGKWIDQDDQTNISSTYKWDKYKNFITHHFTVSVLDRPELEGTQIIAWDPRNKKIHSWLFDSEGGFAEGNWKQEGKKWIVESSQTLPEGELGSQVSILTPIDANSYSLEMTGREVGGEILPNLGPVKIVRKGE